MLVLHAHWQPPAKPDENGTVLFWTETSAAPTEQNNPAPVDGQGQLQDRDTAAEQASGEEPQGGERLRRARSRRRWRSTAVPAHPFGGTVAQSEEALRALGWSGGGRQGTLTLWLPSAGNLPRPSPHLVYDWPMDLRRPPRLARWQVQGLLLPPAAAVAVLLALPPDSDLSPAVRVADDARFWATTTGLVLEATAQQKLLPALDTVEGNGGHYYARWVPVLDGPRDGPRLAQLIAQMPPVCRAHAPAIEEAPAPQALLESFLNSSADALARIWTRGLAPPPTVGGNLPAGAWLQALFADTPEVAGSPAQLSRLQSSYRAWLRSLHMAGDRHVRVAFRLEAPQPHTGSVALAMGPQPEISVAMRMTGDANRGDTGRSGQDRNKQGNQQGNKQGNKQGGNQGNQPGGRQDGGRGGRGNRGRNNRRDRRGDDRRDGRREGGQARADGTWQLHFLLQARDDPSLLVPAAEVWKTGNATLQALGRTFTNPQEKLLAGLGYAARFFEPLRRSLQTGTPLLAVLTTEEAYTFLRTVAPVLEESGFGVLVPPWWNKPGARLGVRLRMNAVKGATPDMVAGGRMSLDKLVDYRWEVALGEASISRAEFDALVALKSPLVQLRGQWVQLDSDQVEAAIKFWQRLEAGGTLSLTDAVQLGLSGAPIEGLDVLEVSYDGWLAEWMARLTGGEKLSVLPQPDSLQGQLRPYQLYGYSWLDFLRRWRLGACLADDMGLGKTIQTLAMLLRIKEDEGALPGPVLLVAPTSVVTNWAREAETFAPGLRVLVHQGAQRLRDEALLAEVPRNDVVLSSYAVVRRDAPALNQVEWFGVVVDEAQNIKNAETQQAQVMRKLPATFRLALTGTPVENRLSELWSIMHFLNPGYLGSRQSFRRQFALPIERAADAEAAEHLRRLVSPFILRRVKTDPTVIRDLPEKQESKVYCYLTAEQATLYEAVVREQLQQIDAAGNEMERKGQVLALLVKLKQICNHPAQFLHQIGDGQGPADKGAQGVAAANGAKTANTAKAANGAKAPKPAKGRTAAAAPEDDSGFGGEDLRSGKLLRLVELLEEVVSVGDRALVFTQFAEMGRLLKSYLQARLGVQTQFLHGGTPTAQRTEMVRRFQEDPDGPPIFVLSLKAGGVGLNLTRATHVFHFDRWWNPAVENQATDRAFRIGQQRNVQVHKFVVTGTLEEKIDEMIEGKQALAASVLGSGEGWLTELSTSQLRELVALRRDALGQELQ
jgi:SNF2 family DNA or RNA helicase